MAANDRDDRILPANENRAWLSMERAEKVPEMVARRILREIVDRGLTDRLNQNWTCPLN